MNKSLIGEMRASRLYMNSTTLLVLLCFTSMIIQPTLAAAAQKSQAQQRTQQPPTSAPTAESQYSKTLQRLERELYRLEKN